TPSNGLAKYGAAVGDERALESDIDTEEESRGRRDDDDVLHFNAGEDGKEQGADTADLARRGFAATDEHEGRFRHEQARRALRKAKCLKERPTCKQVVRCLQSPGTGFDESPLANAGVTA
ncbi:MAG: hypothetical protein Q9198_010023, partial [Flavoplaca austrocitrina]